MSEISLQETTVSGTLAYAVDFSTLSISQQPVQPTENGRFVTHAHINYHVNEYLLDENGNKERLLTSGMKPAGFMLTPEQTQELVALVQNKIKQFVDAHRNSVAPEAPGPA